ncbi:MAG: helix-turn-helix transcriptional regulator [Burkholderiales bacterium]|nr:helix-turn-helix transcriptional regulator [Burkholderiales bacterium]
MPKSTLPTFPGLQRQLNALGLRLRLARERRKLGTELFAERMGISRETLRRMEKGDATIAMGTFMKALRVLGLDSDIDMLAADDALGRKLQDIELLGARRAEHPVASVPTTVQDGTTRDGYP